MTPRYICPACLITQRLHDDGKVPDCVPCGMTTMALKEWVGRIGTGQTKEAILAGCCGSGRQEVAEPPPPHI